MAFGVHAISVLLFIVGLGHIVIYMIPQYHVHFSEILGLFMFYFLGTEGKSVLPCHAFSTLFFFYFFPP